MQENKVNNNHEIIIAESKHVKNINSYPSLSDDGNASLNSADTETTTKTPMTTPLHKVQYLHTLILVFYQTLINYLMI